MKYTICSFVLLLVVSLNGCGTSNFPAIAYSGDLKEVESRLQKGADPNTWGPVILNNNSPLNMAIVGGHTRIAETLIDAGAEVNGFGGASDLATKYRFGNKIKVKAGVRGSPGGDYHYSWSTPIMVAAALGRKRMFDLILEKGGDIYQRGEKNFNNSGEGATVLHYAAAGGNLEIVRYLIEKDLEIDTKISISDDYNGLATPLHIAAMNGNVEVAKILLDAGASAQALYRDNTSTIFAAATNNSPKLIQLLIDHGADMDQTNQYGHSPLSWAVFDGNYEAAEILQENGASLTNDSSNVSTMMQAFVHHFAADRIQISNPDKAISLYSEARKLYEETIPELEAKARNEKLIDSVLTVIANVASVAISEQRAQAQANQLASVSGEPVKYYYTIPIVTDAPGRNSYESHIARSKLGLGRIKAILSCISSDGSNLAICGERAKKIGQTN